jgi:hypothetical protein
MIFLTTSVSRKVAKSQKESKELTQRKSGGPQRATEEEEMYDVL